ncbi:MAG: GNAT family N-acetyltransferase [Actinobacteria bacterium]|nr:GNAT family N-acetyltransferase [Actinomycetota bacterium]
MKDLRLTGPRVVIREWNDGDATAILAYAADPDVVRFMPWGPHTPIEVAEFLLATEASRDENPRKKYEMAVTLRETNEVIGGAGIRVMNGENRHGEIGYVLRRDAWGAGSSMKFLDASGAPCEPEQKARGGRIPLGMQPTSNALTGTQVRWKRQWTSLTQH